MRKTIIVLANSIKHGKHCVAGKCIDSGRWIRPVGNPEGKELTRQQATCRNPYGNFVVKPLQKIEICLQRHVPIPNQPENYLVDGEQWQQRYKIEYSELQNYLDEPADLWGVGDRVEYSSIECGDLTIEDSLYLIKVDDFDLYRNDQGQRRASFTYNAISYDLAVTDPRFDEIYDNNLEIEGIFCVSLGEKFGEPEKCYKLIATIF